MSDKACVARNERNEEAYALARKVVADGIVVKATERLVYQIVEACVDRERESIAAKDAEIAEAYGYATRFLQTFCESNSLGQVEPLPTLCGVLTQIDNATTITRATVPMTISLEEHIARLPESIPCWWYLTGKERLQISDAFRAAIAGAGVIKE